MFLLFVSNVLLWMGQLFAALTVLVFVLPSSSVHSFVSSIYPYPQNRRVSMSWLIAIHVWFNGAALIVCRVFQSAFFPLLLVGSSAAVIWSFKEHPHAFRMAFLCMALGCVVPAWLGYQHVALASLWGSFVLFRVLAQTGRSVVNIYLSFSIPAIVVALFS